MIRLALVLIAVAASAACASGGAYSPRPFPTGPVAGPAYPGTAPGSGTAPVRVAGPAVSPEREALSTALLDTALGLRGVPYRLGGSDLNGFDCSGLVQYVLRQHGIPMPRTVIEQYGVGAMTADVEPGDLVFFQTMGSKASHVGIALDETTFVHAPNSRGVVRVDRLDAEYWSSRFLGARRVF